MADDIDPTGSPYGDTDALTAAVYEELRALRGAHGRLTVEKFSRYPVLHQICGGRTVLDAFLVFERHLQRTIRKGDQYAVAAAISLAADLDTVTARLEEALGHFEDLNGQERNLRTARRWSDQGLHTIARDLVHLGDVQQRLGSELIEITLSGTRAGGVSMVMWQLTTRHREERAPLVRIWKYQAEPDAQQPPAITYDLDLVESPEATRGPFRVRRFDFALGVPTRRTLASIEAGVVIYRFTIEGRDAPLRAVSFQDDSDLSDFFSVRFAAYLTDATIELITVG